MLRAATYVHRGSGVPPNHSLSQECTLCDPGSSAKLIGRTPNYSLPVGGARPRLSARARAGGGRAGRSRPQQREEGIDLNMFPNT